ncbi:DUF2147 domain-containing protein [Kordiimonas marina]|uniref:DUF2147 domain-containing protein n=1 Tax=Kordiimonas marina TaxID=2872312 RepID=UPI001FF1430F|nr:DUF2147 domain-containing protein [Kordiimonas marina]MCJ9429683.1 DUF2147 domain-containing protein [Kordiimonas marina]
MSKFATMVRRVAFAGAAVTMMGAGAAQAADTDIQGYWALEGGAGVVKVAPCGSSAKRLCGTLVWSASGAEMPKVGTQVLKNFRPVANMWGKGKVTDPESGKTLQGRLKPLQDGTLKVSQCHGSLCTYSTWQRPKPDMAGLQTFFEKAGS